MCFISSISQSEKCLFSCLYKHPLPSKHGIFSRFFKVLQHLIKHFVTGRGSGVVSECFTMT